MTDPESSMNLIAEWFRRVWCLLNRSRFDEASRQEMDARDVWGWGWLDSLERDSRFAYRTLRRTPGFTIVSVTSLAVGFALAASTVAVINAYLLRSLPYAAADRLYHVMYAPPGPWEPRGMSALDWASVDDAVEFPITASGETFYLMDSRYTQSVRGLRVARGFVEGLGVRTVLGHSGGLAPSGAVCELRGALLLPEGNIAGQPPLVRLPGAVAVMA